MLPRLAGLRFAPRTLAPLRLPLGAMVRFTMFDVVLAEDDGFGLMVRVLLDDVPEFWPGDVVQLTRDLPSYVNAVTLGVWNAARQDYQQFRMGQCVTHWWDASCAGRQGAWNPCSYLLEDIHYDPSDMRGARISAQVRGSWWGPGRASEWITLYSFERRTCFALLTNVSKV